MKTPPRPSEFFTCEKCSRLRHVKWAVWRWPLKICMMCAEEKPRLYAEMP